MSLEKEIAFIDIEGVSVGNCQNDEAKTGLTVFYFPHTAIGGVDISGGGPASRETPLLDPERSDAPINALVLAGGSAYGLAASDGVLKCLEDNKIGYDTGFALVPLVCQSDIYDLSYGRADVRPDAKMGYEACSNALQKNEPSSGSIGAGCGATVGKLCGMARSQKAGIGYAALQIEQLKIGAVVVVNALGDIYFHGQKIAGLLNEQGTDFVDSVQELYKIQKPTDMFTGRTNTTIGAIFTNGDFSKSQLKKIANMTRAAYDRCIRPVGTMADGDTIYAFSCAKEKINADINVAGTLAAQVMELAIRNACLP